MNAGIVVGIEGTPAGRAALEWAMREGMLRGRPVTVVHACGQPFGREVRAMSDVEARRASACMLDAAVAEAERAVGGKPEIIERSRHGAAATAAAAAWVPCSADLVTTTCTPTPQRRSSAIARPATRRARPRPASGLTSTVTWPSTRTQYGRTGQPARKLRARSRRCRG